MVNVPWNPVVQSLSTWNDTWIAPDITVTLPWPPGVGMGVAEGDGVGVGMGVAVGAGRGDRRRRVGTWVSAWTPRPMPPGR